MSDQIANLRHFFPIEVTATYFAIKELLEENGIGASEKMWLMAAIAGVLLTVNAFIYHRADRHFDVKLQLVVAVGFIIWVANIDTERFFDFPVLGPSIQLTAPIALALYALFTSAFALGPTQTPALAPSVPAQSGGT